MSNYICKLNDSVNREHVRYPNRYGLMIAGDLYTSKNIDKNKKHPALIVGAPYGGVKDVGRILRTFKIKKNVEVTDNGKIII